MSSPQMCLLKYYYCECLGCDDQFANFQRSVELKYMIPKPSLDKQTGIVTVIGTTDATGVKKLLQKATTGKKYFRILPIPNKLETSEAEKEANHPPPPPQQPPREDCSGNIHDHVGESSRMGRHWCAPLNLFSRNKKQHTYIRLPIDDSL